MVEIFFAPSQMQRAKRAAKMNPTMNGVDAWL